MTNTDSTLGISDGRSLLHSPSLKFESLSSHQSLVDGLVGGFAQQATDWRSLAAMMAGGMTYRLGRIGAMAAGTGRLASVGIGLGAEVTAFEMTNRSLSFLTGDAHLNPNLWKWEGNGGIRQGLLSSLVTFGSLKGAGRLAQGENVVVQHILQDTGMVLGHQVSAAFHITPRPTGTLAEQFLHAEATNLQLGAGMTLGYGLTGGRIQALERGLDLSISSTEIPSGERTSQILSGLPRLEAKLQAAAFGVSFDTITVFMSSSNSGNGDKGGKGPRDTLPQVSRPDEVRRPSSQFSSPVFRQGKPYLIEGIPDGVRMVKATGTRYNPLKGIVEAFEKNLAQDRSILVVDFEGEGMDARAQGQLRIEMYRIFRDAAIEEGVPMVVVIPTENQALVFQRKESWVEMKSQSLSPSSTSAPAPVGKARVAPIPPGKQAPPVGEILAMDPARVLTAMTHSLSREKPRVRYTGSIWREKGDVVFLAKRLETVLPADKTFTLVLERVGKQFEFYWSADKILIREKAPNSPSSAPETGGSRTSSSPSIVPPSPAELPMRRRPTNSGFRSPFTTPPEETGPVLDGPRPPMPTPSGESAHDRRLDSLVVREKGRVEELLRKILVSADEGGSSPVIRLNEGRVGRTEILSYARILSEHPMADGQKIIISWNEKGGGRLTLHRQGDRITAELLGKFQVLEENLILLPEKPSLGNLVPYPADRLLLVPFLSQKDYETESEREALDLTKRMVNTDDAAKVVHPGEEGASRRGHLLARAAHHLLRSHERENPLSLDVGELESLAAIHRVLEKAYALLDFDVLESFERHLGPERLFLYETAVDRWNQTAGDRTELIPFIQMSTDLPGSHVIPLRDHVRYALLGQIFPDSPGGRSPRESLALLRDPERLGRVFSSMFRSYIKALLSNVQSLMSLAPGVPLAELFNPKRVDPESIRTLRDEIRTRLQDLGEYERILSEKNSFQRAFFGYAFSSPNKLREPYVILCRLLSELPSDLSHLYSLPSLSDIDQYSRRPSSR